MFSDYSSPLTEFSSSWKRKKKHRESGAQTSEIISYEKSAQTKQPKENGCQTDSLNDVMKSAMEKLASISLESAGLSEFLVRVEPIVSKQLEVNIKFADKYNSVIADNQFATEISLSCKHSLHDADQVSNQKTTEATAVSWSSSGASIAVSLGTNDSLSWSEDRYSICVWNLNRPKIDASKPDQKLETACSVQSLKYHPVTSGFIAAGLFSGEVIVWDISSDIVTKGKSTHNDPVTLLCWFQHSNRKYLKLMSSSSDGSLIIWRFKKGRDGSVPMEIEKRFSINGLNLPRRVGVTGRGSIGITCFVPLKNINSNLGGVVEYGSSSQIIAGCENGLVLKCSIDGDDSNPITFVYESHEGPVYSADWSPFNRHLFLTASTDQLCHIYHSLDAAPLRRIRPNKAIDVRLSSFLLGAMWSLTRPTIFFAAGTKGVLEAIDITSKKSVTTVEITTSNNEKGVHINDIQLNPVERDTLSIAAANGSVLIYTLGAGLVNGTMSVQEEQKRLEKLLKEAMADNDVVL